MKDERERKRERGDICTAYNYFNIVCNIGDNLF